jgi:hypothetical protein
MHLSPAFKATALAIGLLAIFFVLSLCAVRQKSPTFDETLHLFAGYANLKWGDFGLNPEHPPLAKIAAALSLLTLQLNTNGVGRAERDLVLANRGHAWELANRFLFVNNDAEAIFFRAKLVMIFFALALGAVVFIWTRQIFGLGAAMVALFIFCFDPNIMAHSSIVHTDIPFSLFCFMATYFYWRSLRELTWTNLIATGGLFALAAITKFSFVIILPIWLMLGMFKVLSDKPQISRITSPEFVQSRLGKMIVLIITLSTILLMGYVVIWLTYGFRFDAVPYARAQLPVISSVEKNPVLEMLVRFSSNYLLLPDSWNFGVADAFRSLARPAYLLGEIRKEGFWLYFPVAFLTKTPLPTLIMILLATFHLIFAKRREPAVIFLLVPVVIFFLVAVWSHINIGIRHILPIYPFLFVWLGGVGAQLWQSANRLAKPGLLLLAVWLFGSTISAYPDYLAFFNEAAGGAKNGRNILVDSNLDWGQDLKGLKKWLVQNRVDKIQLAYFGTANPNYYGIDADYLPGTLFTQPSDKVDRTRSASHIAISVTYLMGYNLANPKTYEVFRQQQPVAVIGHSIWVYKLAH